MASPVKHDEIIHVDQFVTNKKGHKVAAIIEITELNRIKELLEDLSDLKVIDDRENEAEEDYEAYSKRRQSDISV